jgi:hypothetical protein
MFSFNTYFFCFRYALAICAYYVKKICFSCLNFKTKNPLSCFNYFYEDVQKMLVTLAAALTNNSDTLFKVSYNSMSGHFDTEEDFNKFSERYRNETTKFVRLAELGSRS